jgi:hypothetical protein
MPPTVRITPHPSAWPALVRDWHRPADPARRAVREALGLPTDRPVIMTGHQAALWHCGILAKYLAADAFSHSTSAAAAWIVVDQDEAEFASLRLPALDASGSLRAAEWTLTAPPAEAVPACALGAFDPRPLDLRGLSPALPTIAASIELARSALSARRNEPTAARQVAAATFDLLRPILAGRPIVYATDLPSTASFASLVSQLFDDAPRAAATYNAAATAHPEARLAQLRVDSSRGRTELPLWRIETGSPRLRAFSDNRATASGVSLLPRALLMTAFLRRYACDLFIHGTGGGIYDLATEAWLKQWLGWDLAPTVVVTADLALPLPAPSITREQALQAMWLAHRARHDPALAGRADLAAEKARLVQEIAAARRAGADPLPPYKRLHTMLDKYRRAEAPRLEAIAREAGTMRESLARITLATDRAWPFILHEPAALASLKQAVERALLTTPAASS